MTLEREYSEFVRSRAKSGAAIAETLTQSKFELWYREVYRILRTMWRFDQIKRMVIYNAGAPNGDDPGLELPLVPEAFTGLTSEKLELLHAATGIVTEAQEFLETVARHVFSGQPLDERNLLKERGDLSFYLEASRLVTGGSSVVDEEDNMAKLKARYPAGYADAAAVARADENPV